MHTRHTKMTEIDMRLFALHLEKFSSHIALAFESTSRAVVDFPGFPPAEHRFQLSQHFWCLEITDGGQHRVVGMEMPFVKFPEVTGSDCFNRLRIAVHRTVQGMIPIDKLVELPTRYGLRAVHRTADFGQHAIALLRQSLFPKYGMHHDVGDEPQPEIKVFTQYAKEGRNAFMGAIAIDGPAHGLDGFRDFQ